jgi:hypothetical protein
LFNARSGKLQDLVKGVLAQYPQKKTLFFCCDHHSDSDTIEQFKKKNTKNTAEMDANKHVFFREAKVTEKSEL